MTVITRSLSGLSAGMVAAVLGCAGAPTVPRSSDNAFVSPRNVLTAEEIRVDRGARDALGAIRRLRPWFLERGLRPPAVFVNGKRYYDLMDLSTIGSNEILEVRYMTAPEALVPFGGSNDAIVITTGRPPATSR